jgi:hypothetical protein
VQPDHPLLALQAATGNRAVGRLLARRPYDERLAKGSSALEPPLAWVKSPPVFSAMTPLELVDAGVLIDRWIGEHGSSPDRAELKRLRERMRAEAKRRLRAKEFATLSKATKVGPDQLAELYDKVAAEFVEKEGDVGDWDLDTLDAIVEDRFPGAAWGRRKHAEIRAVVAEQGRRKTRLEKLPWYLKATYEKFEAKARALPAQFRNTWRELAWLFINSRDAGDTHKQAEEKVIRELVGMYEQMLHVVDDAIQVECKRNKPRTWDEKVRRNLANAYGDPCKPWFGPHGTKGPDELHEFERTLRIKRGDDQHASIYSWVEEYYDRYLLLTDPKRQLKQMQAQALAGWAVHLTGMGMATTQVLGQRALPAISRRLTSFMRNLVLGVHVSVGEVGSTGAEVGGAVNRPRVVQVERPATPSGPVRINPAQHPDAPHVDPVTKPTAPAQAKPPPQQAQKPGAPPTQIKPPVQRPAQPAPATLRKPTNSKYATVGELRQAIAKALGLVTNAINPEWTRMLGELDRGLPKTRINAELMKSVYAVYVAIRDKHYIEETAAAVWERAAADQTTTEEALRRMAADGQQLPVMDQLLDPEPFRQYLLNPLPFVDEEFKGDNHGAYTHVFQELVLATALGSRTAARRFRHVLAESLGQGEVAGKLPKNPFWSRLWDAIFDAAVPGDRKGGSWLNNPETLGPILHEHLDLPNHARRRP